LWDKKDVILKNKAEKLLIIKVWPQKTNRNKPENISECRDRESWKGLKGVARD